MEITDLCVELAILKTTSFSSRRSDAPTQQVGPIEFNFTSKQVGSGQLHNISVSNNSKSPISLKRLGFRIDSRPRLLLENGYQSWSPVRRCTPYDRRPTRRFHPLMATGCYHANAGSAGSKISGDQLLIWEQDNGQGGVCCFLDSKVHLSSIEVGSESAKTNESQEAEIWAWALMDRISIAPGELIQLDPLWISVGDTGMIYSEAAQLWGDQANARLDKPSPATPQEPGWCSWYQYWWKISPDQIRHNLAIARDHSMKLFVLDDGYQDQVGDWLVPNERWSKPGSLIGDVADDIRSAGLTPGIWTAPFLVGKKSQIAKSHPEWIIRAKRGAYPLPIVYNPLGWNGWVYGLDTTQEPVLDHIRETFSQLTELGYNYHKIDFCYAATMPGRRALDGKVTRAQALRSGLEAVRQGIGDSSYLLGCGCPFGPAVGVVDAMRVSPDVSPWWNPTLLKWPSYPDSAPSAINSVRASVLRAPLHRRLFVNDPDCVLLRSSKNRLDPNQRKVVLEMAAGTGGFVVLSDNLGLYGSNEWKLIDEIRALGNGLDTTLDIDDPFSQTVTVSSSAANLKINWGEDPGIPLNGPGWHLDGVSGHSGPWSSLKPTTD